MDVAAFGKRVVHHLAWRTERLGATAIDAVRRGDRTVIMTPPVGPRFGNWLYYWLRAHRRTNAGQRTVVRKVDAMAPWLVEFPTLKALTVDGDLLRFNDRRDGDTAASVIQRFGEEFTAEELDSFIQEALAPHLHRNPRHELVINIRRGDYYSSSRESGPYAFDIPGYLRAALEVVGGSPTAVVVSDDPQWCRENLDELLRRHAPRVDYAATDPVSNFRTLAGAQRLVGTNSTFSYWGGYVVGVLADDPLVVMPRFHRREPHGNAAFQLDPRWVVIEGFD